MASTPEWFLDAWWKCGFHLEGVWPVTRRAGWSHRYLARDSWTYIAVLQGTVALRQGAWTCTLEEAYQTVLPPRHAFEVRILSPIASCLNMDFRVFSTWLAEDPLPRIGLPVALRCADPTVWRKRCTQLASLFGDGGGEARDTVVESRPIADALVGAFLTQGFGEEVLAPASLRAVPDWVVSMKAELDGEYRNPRLRVEHVAKATGFCMAHVHHEFKRAFGTTPRAHLIARRIRLACHLLDTITTEHVSEVAARCGFQSHSHFTRTFMRQLGITPTQWRRRGRDTGIQPAAERPQPLDGPALLQRRSRPSS